MADRSIQLAVAPEPIRRVNPHEEILRALENEVLESNLKVFADAAKFAQVDPEKLDEIPPEWVLEHGMERAVEMFRTAKYALMPAKEAPVGLSMAKAIVTAGVKARAERQQRVGTLNIGQVLIVGNAPVYEELEVVDER